jgi:hypothetical protein
LAGSGPSQRGSVLVACLLGFSRPEGSSGRPFDSAAPCVEARERISAPGAQPSIVTGWQEAFDVGPLSASFNHTELLWFGLGVGNRPLLPPSWQRRLFHIRETFHDWPDVPNNCDQVLLVY